MNKPRFLSRIWVLFLLLMAFGCENGGDAGAAVDQDASDEKECEPGSTYGASTGDEGVPPKIRTMSDLALLEGYEGLRADLMIPYNFEEGSEIDNLGHLHCLTSVGGIFSIGPLKALKSLDGLENLASAAWGITITRNDSLINVDGLIGLESVGKGAEFTGHEPGWGSLSIRSNNSLLNLKGLANITYFYGNLNITNNKSLPTCEAVALKERVENGEWTGEATICGNLPDECGFEPCPNE